MGTAVESMEAVLSLTAPSAAIELWSPTVFRVREVEYGAQPRCLTGTVTENFAAYSCRRMLWR